MLNKLFLILAFFILHFAPAFSQNDFDYTFYPADKYTRQTRIASLDSASQKVIWKTDSTGSVMRVCVEKKGDELKVFNLSNPTNILYREKVKYLGIDANQCLIYEAQTEKKEILTLSPVLGFALVTFRNCEGNKFAKNPEDCDKVMHCFGSILNQYKLR